MYSFCWNHRPEEEGITTCHFADVFLRLTRWNHRPEEEGITTADCAPSDGHRPAGITALKKKGLRRATRSHSRARRCWNHRPEEEGITTDLGVDPDVSVGWNHRPEEEGITTGTTRGYGDHAELESPP